MHHGALRKGRAVLFGGDGSRRIEFPLWVVSRLAVLHYDSAKMRDPRPASYAIDEDLIARVWIAAFHVARRVLTFGSGLGKFERFTVAVRRPRGALPADSAGISWIGRHLC